MSKLQDEDGFKSIALPVYDSSTQLINSSGKKAPQYIAGLTASLAALSMGTTLAWTSQISVELQDGALGFPLTSDQIGWVGSLMPLGAAVLSLFTGSMCELLGRKMSMLVLVIPATIGWSLMAWAQNVAMLYCGRFITGMVAGSFCVLSLLYTSEVAQKEIRGAMGSFTQMMISGGILFANVVAIFLEIPEYTMTCGAIPIVFGAIFLFMPETPVYLIKKNRLSEARAVLVRLRGENYDVDKEMKEIETRLMEHQAGSVMQTVWESLKKPSSRKACVIGFGLMIFKVTNGIDAVTAYTSDIFKAVNSDIPIEIAVVILNVFQVVSAIFQSFVVDKSGRKVLLWVSASVMTVCLSLVGLTFLLKDRDIIAPSAYVYVNYLPLVALVIFTVAFSLGLGPIPWLMLGEIFPQEIKSLAASTATFVSWIMAFVVTKLFVVVDESWGTDVAFFVFAVCTFLAVIFTVVLVPETKNKTFDEIQKELE